MRPRNEPLREVYLHDYQSVREAREQLGGYFRFYNEERFHSSLGKQAAGGSIFWAEGKLTGKPGGDLIEVAGAQKNRALRNYFLHLKYH